MGVTGLWSELKTAATPRTYEKIALEVFDDAYEELSDGKAFDSSRLMGLRVGIDASAWFFHSYESEGGANPEVRNLFHRIIRLSKSGALALFVFDGPYRPSMKRGNRIYRGEHSFQAPLIRIIEAFGYEWRVAPGEAEAELAMLSLRGDIDLIITDDVDSLLFGATRVLKHALINNPTPSNTPTLYERHDIELAAELTIPGLILVALMSGGDYDQAGLDGVGPIISIALAKGGYGEQLQEAIKTRSGSDLQNWLSEFRDDIRYQLTTNEKKLLARKAAAVAKKIPDSWPAVETAKRYYDPITSNVKKYKDFDRKHDWSGRICVSLLTEIMDDLFEFTHAEILQKFRNQIWDCVIVHHLIRALYRPNLETSISTAPVLESPSKQLANALDDFSIESPTKGSSSKSKKSKKKAKPSNMPDEALSLFLRVTKARTYNPGKKITQELQLFIDPRSLVEEAKSALQHPDPNIGKLRQRKEEHAARMCALHGPEHPSAIVAPDRNTVYDDPDKEVKLWVQESLLRMAYPQIVEDWEQAEREKAEAKVNKGKGKAGRTTTKSKASPKSKGQKQKLKSKSSASREISSASEEEEPEPDAFSSPEPPKKLKAKATLPFIAVKKAPASAATKPSLARRASEPLSSSGSGSDSDIEVIQNPPGPKASKEIIKSPKKSPRRSHETATARSSSSSTAGKAIKSIKPAASSAPASLSSNALGDTKKQAPSQPKKVYEYTDVDDTDSDLPDLPKPLHFGKPSKGKGKEKAKSPVSVSMKPATSASSSASASTSSKSKKPVEVIDLCSSD